jgi:quaternary ammonium compound-resistance protein SugE
MVGMEVGIDAMEIHGKRLSQPRTRGRPRSSIFTAGTPLANPLFEMPWFYLVLAGLTEIAWAIGLKYTHGWTRLWPSLFTASLMIVSFALLSQALKNLPIGTAYAVWTGIGAVGTALTGILIFGEPKTAFRLLCIALILAGIIGLKLSAGQASTDS